MAIYKFAIGNRHAYVVYVPVSLENMTMNVFVKRRNIAAALLSFAPFVISHGGNSMDTMDEDGLLLFLSSYDVAVVFVSDWKTVCEVVVCGYPEPSSNGIAPDARFLAMRCSGDSYSLVITFAASDIVCSFTSSSSSG